MKRAAGIIDAIGPSGVDRALGWALNGTGRIVVPGCRHLWLNASGAIGESTISASLGLSSVTIDGVEGFRIQPARLQQEGLGKRGVEVVVVFWWRRLPPMCLLRAL